MNETRHDDPIDDQAARTETQTEEYREEQTVEAEQADGSLQRADDGKHVSDSGSYEFDEAWYEEHIRQERERRRERWEEKLYEFDEEWHEERIKQESKIRRERRKWYRKKYKELYGETWDEICGYENELEYETDRHWEEVERREKRERRRGRAPRKEEIAKKQELIAERRRQEEARIADLYRQAALCYNDKKSSKADDDDAVIHLFGIIKAGVQAFVILAFICFILLVISYCL